MATRIADRVARSLWQRCLFALGTLAVAATAGLTGFFVTLLGIGMGGHGGMHGHGGHRGGGFGGGGGFSGGGGGFGGGGASGRW